jgi:hypothetical protein
MNEKGYGGEGILRPAEFPSPPSSQRPNQFSPVVDV